MTLPPSLLLSSPYHPYLSSPPIPTYLSKGKFTSNTPMNVNESFKNYAIYAKNINPSDLTTDFSGKPGEKKKVHGDKKSVKSVGPQVVFHSMTMVTTDGKFKVWVFRGKGEKWQQDCFEVEIPTREEVVRVMLERATGLDACGNKIEVTE
jgi:hypothetical protein